MISLTSIIILTHDQLEYTMLCIESIQKHTHVPYELIIVDNGSTDGTVEYLKDLRSRYINIKTIFNKENLGYAMGNNMGFSASEGRYLIIMNNDVIVTENWLSGLLHVAEDVPDAGIVGPMTNYTAGEQKVSDVHCKSISEIEEFANSFKDENGISATNTGRVIGFCMLIKREVIQKIGGFDPRFGLGNFEDDDFCLRVAIAGFKIVIANFVFVYHYGGVSFSTIGGGKYRALLEYNWKRLSKKWGITENAEQKMTYDCRDLYTIPFDPDSHYIPFNMDEYLKPDILPLRIEGVKRFSILCLQDWESDYEWSAIIDSYINTFSKSDDTSLIFYVDTVIEESGEEVLSMIHDYLDSKGLSPDEIADITILAIPLSFSKRGILFKSVDLFMSTGGFLNRIYATEMARCGVPIITPTDTGTLRELYETTITNKEHTKPCVQRQ